MNYTKPEVAILGGATRVIEQTGIKNGFIAETPMLHRLSPAYDLDE